MINRDFDDIVKEQFGNYKPDVPAHIWENIAAQKDRKKPFAFWLNNWKFISIAACILIALGGSLFYFNTNTTEPANNIQPIAEKKIDAENKLPENKLDNKNTENNLSKTDAPVSRKPSIESMPNNTKDITWQPSNDLQQGNTNKTDSHKKHISQKSNYNLVVTNGKAEMDQVEIEQQTLKLSDVFRMDLLNKQSNFKPSLSLQKLPKSNGIPCPEAERNTAGNKQYVEIYAGPDYIFTSYDDTANSAYLQKRKASTGIDAAYSAGLRYSRVFKNGVSLKTGINYSKIIENFISKNGFISERVYVVNNLGDTTGSFTKITAQYNRSKNVYQSIDIPLLMGFEFGNGRLHTNISAGASVNIFSKQAGMVIDVNGNPVDITSGKSNSSIYHYKKSAGISFLGSVAFYYKLNEQFHVMAEPYLRYSLSSITKPDITFKQKFQTAGIKLGVRYDLK